MLRWCGGGTTSFDMAFEARVGDRLVLTATVYYVGVSVGDYVLIPPPAAIRAHLG